MLFVYIHKILFRLLFNFQNYIFLIQIWHRNNYFLSYTLLNHMFSIPKILKISFYETLLFHRNKP